VAECFELLPLLGQDGTNTILGDEPTIYAIHNYCQRYPEKLYNDTSSRGGTARRIPHILSTNMDTVQISHKIELEFELDDNLG
jgi:hypothetical protein